MVWRNALYGHFGLDLTGTNGGVVRVDDIVIEDVSNTNNVAVYEQPFAVPGIGTGGRQARIVFGTAVKGAIRVTIRVDNPT
jgi:hypothetical protein